MGDMPSNTAVAAKEEEEDTPTALNSSFSSEEGNETPSTPERDPQKLSSAIKRSAYTSDVDDNDSSAPADIYTGSAASGVIHAIDSTNKLQPMHIWLCDTQILTLTVEHMRMKYDDYDTFQFTPFSSEGNWNKVHPQLRISGFVKQNTSKQQNMLGRVNDFISRSAVSFSSITITARRILPFALCILVGFVVGFHVGQHHILRILVDMDEYDNDDETREDDTIIIDNDGQYWNQSCASLDMLYKSQKEEYLKDYKDPIPRKSTGKPKRFAVFTNAGDHNNVKEWLECGGAEFDLLVNFYGHDDEIGRELETIADRYRSGPGFKVNCLADWVHEEPELLNGYHAVAVWDDDAHHASTGKINALFHILMNEELTWLSPTWTGQHWHDVDHPQPNSYLRYQEWFDMTFFVLRKDALMAYLEQHLPTAKGWGEDVLLWNFLGREKLNECETPHSAITDAIIVENPPTRSDGVRESTRSSVVGSGFNIDKVATETRLKIQKMGYQFPGTNVTQVYPIGKVKKDIPPFVKSEIKRCEKFDWKKSISWLPRMVTNAKKAKNTDVEKAREILFIP